MGATHAIGPVQVEDWNASCADHPCGYTIQSMRLTSVLGGILFSACICGCSTVTTIASGIREPWSGSQLDVYILSSPEASFLRTAAAALDYPFSLIADAAVLAFLKPGSVEPFQGPDLR